MSAAINSLSFRPYPFAEGLIGTLTITFHSGKSYDYPNVPLPVYLAFEAADSKGEFYRENFK
jgi:hypothetical protein